MEPRVAPRGVPTPIESLPAPQAACRSPINALRQTGLAPAHPGPSTWIAGRPWPDRFISECRRHMPKWCPVIAGCVPIEATKGHRASCCPKSSRSNPPRSSRLETKVPRGSILDRLTSGKLNLMSTAPRPIPGRPDETPRPGPAGPRTPYPVNDPGFADPNKPGSEPDYIPPPSPGGTPEL
jgi:hypothetical protein